MSLQKVSHFRAQSQITLFPPPPHPTPTHTPRAHYEHTISAKIRSLTTSVALNLGTYRRDVAAELQHSFTFNHTCFITAHFCTNKKLSLRIKFICLRLFQFCQIEVSLYNKLKIYQRVPQPNRPSCQMQIVVGLTQVQILAKACAFWGMVY